MRKILLLLCFWLLPCSLLHAQTVRTDALQAQLEDWKTQLDGFANTLKKTPLQDAELSQMTGQLETVKAQLQAFIERNKPLVKDIKILLDKLGPAPKKDEPPEAREIAEQREELEKRFAQSDGLIKSATALLARSRQMREQVLDLRRTLFRQQILHKGRSPFSLSLWREGVPDLSHAVQKIARILGYWSERHTGHPLLWLTLFAGLLSSALFLMTKRWIDRWRQKTGQRPPPFFTQLYSAALISLLRALPFLTGAALFYGGMVWFELLSNPMDELTPLALGAFAIIASLFALSTTLLAPRHPRWRIFPVASPVARRLNLLLLAIAIIYGVDLFLGALNRIFQLPLSLTILQSAMASVLFTALLIAVLRTPFKAHRLASESARRTPHYLARTLQFLLWLIVFAVLLATALGYIALARFLTQQTVVTGSILILAYLAHLAIDEFTEGFGQAETSAGQFLQQNFSIDPQRREQIGAVAMLLLNALLFLFILPFLALQWGFGWVDVMSWTRAALFGFEFGGLHISLFALFVALLLFALGVLATRWFQSWLDQKILSKNRSQTGAEDSIRTVVGYLGFILSALIALSYAGIGFGNIALVAGALSVGIGFGLQSIVNNFVSGLILLAERPIKVGDWIAVGGDEGNVRRISVRSTEIETFDRSHIIIPNSQLISGTVKNWTLRNHFGRIIINVGVSYEADPDEVQDLLLNIAKAHPDILSYPEPYVRLIDFGASSLDFTLRAYLGDITKSLRVRSQLRVEILKALRQANIDIPFPQTDLHLHDMDRLEKALHPTSPRPAPARAHRPRRNRKKTRTKPTDPPSKPTDKS